MGESARRKIHPVGKLASMTTCQISLPPPWPSGLGLGRYPTRSQLSGPDTTTTGSPNLDRVVSSS
jgi:hypothetical protein